MRNMKDGPRGTLDASFAELHAAGCIQTGADVSDNLDDAKQRFMRMFVAMCVAKGDNPCDGCPAYHGGTCAAFKKYHSSQRRKSPPGLVPGQKTVKQLAAEHGISLSEVRRRKLAGTL